MDHIEGELHSNALAVSENSETSIGRMLQELCVTLDPNVDGFFLEKSQFLTTPPPPLPLVLGFLIANFEYDRPHPLCFFSKKNHPNWGQMSPPQTWGGPRAPPPPPPPSPFRNGQWDRPG